MSDLTPPTPLELNIMKQGETSFTATLFRSNKGLQLEVHAHPDVEDFMASLGSGEVQEVRTLGRHWEPLDKSQRLQVYTLATSPGRLYAEDGTVFCIDRPGLPILDETGESGMADLNGRPLSILNLSFLRLVGISKGVRFAVSGVHTNDAVRTLLDRIGTSYKRFYGSYIKPLKISVVVSTQEMPLR